MNFTDPQIKACFERNFAEVREASNEVRQVRALIAAHDFFQMIEGPDSSRVHETIWHLLLPELRPGLRAWYGRPGLRMDSRAIELRDQLSQLAGDQFHNGPNHTGLAASGHHEN